MTNNVQEVTLDPLNGGPGNNWTVHHGGQSGSTPSTYPEVSLVKDSGPWIIHFKINSPGNNITFSSDPIWVQPGSKPTSHTIDPQINAVKASADGKELFILDKNDNPNGQQLFYSLQFNGHGSVDPILDNGGHTMISPYPTATNTVTLQYAVFGLVLLAAFVLGAIAGRLIRSK